MRKDISLLSVLVILFSCSLLLGQTYDMERSVIASGTPYKTSTNYTMSEGAFMQTAADTTFSVNWADQQGYIHRPYNLVMEYAGIPVAPTLEPGTGWYEPTGQMSIHAQDTMVIGDIRYVFAGWTSTTDAAFDTSAGAGHELADSMTWFPFYKSHTITANYNVQHRVIFATNTYNDEAYSLGPTDTYYDSLADTNYAVISYYSRDNSTNCNVWDAEPETVWADDGADYTYADLSSYSGTDERWILDPDPSNPGSGTTDLATTITASYYDQFNGMIDIIYDPTGDPTTGDLEIINWDYANTDSSASGGPYNETSDWENWADAGSNLEFPETTTGGWYTTNIRQWEPLNKPITKTVIYGQPVSAQLSAGMVLWRNYKLMGVPIYPIGDTTSYKAYATDHGCTISGQLSRGDQDVMFYDDFDSDCDWAEADSNCGMYEIWWRVSKYYPQNLGYRRYRGPGAYYEEGNVEPFWPGRGYWLVQDHCDEIGLDAFGTVPDSTDTFAVGLARNNGSESGSCYNMVATPFFDPNPSNDILVFWNEAMIWKADDQGTADSDPGTLSVADAAVAGWIDGAAQMWRDLGGGSWGYKNYNAAETGDPGDPAYMTDTLYEWEGFWIKTGNVDAEDVGDSLVLLMQTHYSATRMRERPTPTDDLLAYWQIKFGAECRELGQSDMWNFAGYKEYQPTREYRPLKQIEMPEFTYPESYLRTYFVNDEMNQYSEIYMEDRAPSMTWPAMLDCRATKGHKVEVKWELENIPTDFEVHLKDPDHDEWIDMTTQDAYSFVSDGSIHPVQIIVNPTDAWVFAAKEIAEETTVPEEFYLNSPNPNPFNSSCNIEFGLANGDDGNVDIKVYDILGKKVRQLMDSELDPGYYNVVWEGRTDAGNRVPSGTYFIRFEGAGRKITKKVSLIK